MLQIKNLVINYTNNEILNSFNLSLSKGEIFALLGESGSGKSSALRFIAGLDDAKNGEIKLEDVQLSTKGKHNIAPELRKICMVFQENTLFPHMNIGKNIAFGINHLDKNQQQQKVKELLALIGLKGIEKKYPHQLSGGEQQRVALARALAPSPKLLLLDEPFSGLDENNRCSLSSQVKKILKQQDVTSILVTHDKSEAYSFADQVGEIKNKCLQVN